MSSRKKDEVLEPRLEAIAKVLLAVAKNRVRARQKQEWDKLVTTEYMQLAKRGKIQIRIGDNGEVEEVPDPHSASSSGSASASSSSSASD